MSERRGLLRVVTIDGTVGEPLTGVPQVARGADAGLLDVVIHPRFAENRTFFFTYSEPADGGSRLTVAREAFHG